jgi:hypothetical protein
MSTIEGFSESAQALNDQVSDQLEAYDRSQVTGIWAVAVGSRSPSPRCWVVVGNWSCCC